MTTLALTWLVCPLLAALVFLLFGALSFGDHTVTACDEEVAMVGCFGLIVLSVLAAVVMPILVLTGVVH